MSSKEPELAGGRAQDTDPYLSWALVYDPVLRDTFASLGDGCTCEKATVRASSSGPVIFLARSIHTWIEQPENTWST